VEEIPHPIIGYIGTIQSRVDINLLEYLAQKNPDKSLVLIGPIWPEFLKKIRRPAIEIRLKKYKNVYFLGRKSYQESPKYIHQFDVAIIPHKLDEFIKYTHSLKLLEYLACGKPVVTTPASGAEKFSHLIYIAQDYRDFNEKIQKALTENNPELVRLRLEAARENSWSLRFEKMMELILQMLNS
jgi:glycosyltransferase involved in cell wall biosynthesis